MKIQKTSQSEQDLVDKLMKEKMELERKLKEVSDKLRKIIYKY